MWLIVHHDNDYEVCMSDNIGYVSTEKVANQLATEFTDQLNQIVDWKKLNPPPTTTTEGLQSANRAAYIEDYYQLSIAYQRLLEKQISEICSPYLKDVAYNWNPTTQTIGIESVDCLSYLG
jgi:hypothetical protein